MPDAGLAEIEACVFDAYGTLFDFNSPLEARRGRLGDAPDRFAELWRRKQLEYSWLRSLMGRHADFWKVTGEALDYAMAAHGIDDPGLRAELMQLYLELDAYPDAPDVVSRLKQTGYRTAILSNGSPTMLTAAVNRAALNEAFDTVLSVEECAIYKPHPTVYQYAADRVKTQAGHIAFLSANAWDVAGAAAFGFKVVWVNRTGAAPENLPGAPVAEIRSLEELPALLSG